MKRKLYKRKVRALIKERNTEELTSLLANWQSPEIADLVNRIPDPDKAFVFTTLPYRMVFKTFKVLDLSSQRAVIKNLRHGQAAKILNEIQPDDRTQFLSELPGILVKDLLQLLSEEERLITLKQLGYPEHSVGRLMTPEYLAVYPDWSVQQVLDHIRANGKDKETINVIYIIDNEGRLLDDLRIRELLLAPTDKKVQDLMDNKFNSLKVTDDEETAIQEFRKNNRVALPVLDDAGIMIGIVTIDDVLRLAVEEETENIQKIGGVEALDEPYMKIPFLKLMKKRSGWLVVLFLGEMLTATAMGFFEGEIAKAVVLALFVPLIISSGGNSGSQASSLIIRAMALGEVTFRDWWHVMRREFSSGLFLGSVLGIIGFTRVTVWTMFTTIYGEFSIAFVILHGTLL